MDNMESCHTYRSGHGGSVRGDDDTCSLPTTTWSGQQARTPIAVRRLGPLQPAPSPHHQAPAKPRAWLGRIAKLAALGLVVAVSAAGVIKVRSARQAVAYIPVCCWTPGHVSWQASGQGQFQVCKQSETETSRQSMLTQMVCNDMNLASLHNQRSLRSAVG